jgi:hypothetical protein
MERSGERIRKVHWKLRKRGRGTTVGFGREWEDLVCDLMRLAISWRLGDRDISPS